MKDEVYLKKDNLSLTTDAIPYYRKKEHGWIIQMVEHSIAYRIKRDTGVIGNEPKVKPKKIKADSTRGGIADVTMEYMVWASETYGSTMWKHPRTNEKLDFVSETNRKTDSMYAGLRLRLYDNKHYNGLPRIPYHRQANRQCSIKLIVNIESGEVFVKPESEFRGNPTKQWKGIWNMTKRGTPRKFNYMANGKYNWGDQHIIRQQEITERCNILCKQIRQREGQQ